MKPSRLLSTTALAAALAAGACVDVPDPSPVGGDPMDAAAGPDGAEIDSGPDAERDGVADGFTLDALPDATRLDMRPDALTLDMRPLDMRRDMPRFDMRADIGRLDMAIDPELDQALPDAAPIDMGLPDGPLVFSGCLPLANGVAAPGVDEVVPCLQVAVATPMPERLSWRSAVVLPDGRVAVIGGLRTGDGGIGEASARVDIYDPTRDVWRGGSPLNVGRWAHTAEHVRSNVADALLALGGAGDTGEVPWMAHGDVQRWEYGRAGPWVPSGGRLPGGAEGASWGDGSTVWYTGGHNGPRSVPSDRATTWVLNGGPINGGTLTEARYGHAMVGLRGMPLVIGGAGDQQSAINSAEVYTGDAWLRIPSDSLRRAHPAAAVLGDRVLVAGGRSHGLDYLPAEGIAPTRFANTTFIKQAVGGLWQVEVGPEMHRTRFSFGLEPIGNGYALAVGGDTSAEGAPVVELFVGGAQPSWLPFTLPPPADRVRSHHAMVALPDGRIFVAGGVWTDAADGSDELFMEQTLIFRVSERDLVALPDGTP